MLPISIYTSTPGHLEEQVGQSEPFYVSTTAHAHYAARPKSSTPSTKMQTHARVPVDGRVMALQSRQSTPARPQSASLSLPRTARRCLQLLKPDSDVHAYSAQRLPGTTNFSSAVVSRSTVLCGPGIAHPSEVRILWPIRFSRISVPSAVLCCRSCSASANGGFANTFQCFHNTYPFL